jgi:hypothetical protein
LSALLLVTSGSSSTSGSFELSSLGSDEWLGVRAGNTWSAVVGEVSFSLSLLSGSLKEDGVLSLGVLESELIESDDFTTSGSNSLSSGLGDSESANSELGDLKESDVVGDGTNNNSSLVLSAISLHLSDESSKRKWGSVDAGHKQSLEDDLVEGGIGSSGQEAVSFDEEAEVDILGDRGASVRSSLVLAFVMSKINAHGDGLGIRLSVC